LEAINAWSVIDQLDHHVIASTWAFIQMDLSKKSKHISVRKVINSLKEFISSKHMYQSSN
jgi:hypothetical protein